MQMVESNVTYFRFFCRKRTPYKEENYEHKS